MGGNQSTEKDLSEYKVHDRIGVYKHIQQNGEHLIELLRQLPNERIEKEWAERIKDIKHSMEGSQLVYLPLRHVYQKTQLCGSGGTLHMIFDQWQNFLKDEVNNRRKNNHFYTEEQLWFILYSIVKVGLLYEGRNSKMGDLHPNNIVVSPEGFIKVITKDSMPQGLTNFQKIIEQIKTDVYLAPEEMDETMIESGVYTVKDASKADAFSFGITMLEAITLQNCSYLYIRNPLRISFQKLQTYTNIMKQKYSSALYQIVMSALQPLPQNRKSFLQIFQTLRPHQNKIIQMQPFTLTGSKANRQGLNESVQSINQSLAMGQRSVNTTQQVHIKLSPHVPPSQQFFGLNKR